MTEKDHYNDFLLKDFEQQYQEYRKEETSRIHYVEFLISLVTATLAFFASFYSYVGFPATNIYPVLTLLFFSIILFCVGYRVEEICVSTRVSQIKTAKYLNEVTKYFLKFKENGKLEGSRKKIYFGDEISEKTPFHHLMKIIIFLLGVLTAVMLFSVSRIIFFILESSGFLAIFGFPKLFAFWEYSTWSNFISGIVGIITLLIAYKLFNRRFLKELKKKANDT